jgi:serine/threonine protein kinase
MATTIDVLAKAKRPLLEILAEKNVKVFAGEKNHISGKTAEILFGTSTVDVAIKTTHIADPNDYNDTCYREFRVLKSLQFMRAQKLCPNFIHMMDWCKSNDTPYKIDEEDEDDTIMYDTTLDERIFGLQEPPKFKSTPVFTNVTILSSSSQTKREPKQQYMNIVMERAVLTIDQYLTNSDNIVCLPEFKCILFQILFALHISQRYCGFVHNDLHLGNIMLQKCDVDSKVSHEICYSHVGHRVRV